MKSKNIFSKIFSISLFIIFIFILCDCKNINKSDLEPIMLPGGDGKGIIFNRDDLVLNARKNKVSFKAKNVSGMDIIEIYTIIDDDTTYFKNETYLVADQYGESVDFLTGKKKSLTQYFYHYRDTVYGDWYAIINKGRNIYVKLNENTTNISRKLIVLVQNGNSFGAAKVTQEGKKKQSR